MIDLNVILIINGRRTIDQVNPRFRDAVRDILAVAGLDENGYPVQN